MGQSVWAAGTWSCIAAVVLSVPGSAAGPKKAVPQPAPAMAVGDAAVERLDLAMLDRIRQEELQRSHVMEYASALFDGIGPRLTGSPQFAQAAAWTRDQLARMGCTNAHLESWGDFGMGWQQIGTTVELSAPVMATFVGQATPWSPATAGADSGAAVTAEVVRVPRLKEEKDLAAWKGKLKGKVILYGAEPKFKPGVLPLTEHYNPAELTAMEQLALGAGGEEDHALPTDPAFWEDAFKHVRFKERVGTFFHDEGAVAVLMEGGGDGALQDDTNRSLGWYVYRPDRKQAVPSAVVASEAFGRMSRILAHGVPVTARVRIATEFTGDHVDGENVLAEIAGTDPALKAQVVMLGGHLDSWIAGTGATDDGAGVVIAMEVMRVLKAVGVAPRRTIRVALWGGEEEGIFGSARYVAQHFATVPFSTKPEQQEVPEFVRERVGPPVVKPEHALLSAYFNVDNGAGRLKGIYAQGNSAAARIFEQWGAPLRDIGFSTVSPRDTGSTDHMPFDEAGLPGFQFIQDPLDYETYVHHTSQDVYEQLPEEDLKQAVVVMASFVYDAAMRDGMMPRKAMPDPLRDGQSARPLEGVFPGGKATTETKPAGEQKDTAK